VPREKSIGITLRKPPENSLRRYTLRLEKCIMTRCKLLVPAAICAVLIGGAGFVSAYTGEELAKYAKVTLPEARAIALKAFPGIITDEELEKEKGGGGLRYSFDIKNGGVTHEVGIRKTVRRGRNAPAMGFQRVGSPRSFKRDADKG
jgi:hypothetical protein